MEEFEVHFLILSKDPNTVRIRIPDGSGIRMDDSVRFSNGIRFINGHPFFSLDLFIDKEQKRFFKYNGLG